MLDGGFVVPRLYQARAFRTCPLEFVKGRHGGPEACPGLAPKTRGGSDALPWFARGGVRRGGLRHWGVLGAAAAPVLSSFSPASGTIGAAVTITGSGFAGATKVTFNAVTSQFTVNSASKITATVPVSASTGPIAVTTPAGTSSSATNFTVTPGIVLAPASGAP